MSTTGPATAPATHALELAGASCCSLGAVSDGKKAGVVFVETVGTVRRVDPDTVAAAESVVLGVTVGWSIRR